MAKKNTPATPAEVADGAQENQEGQEVLGAVEEKAVDLSAPPHEPIPVPDGVVIPPPPVIVGRFQYLPHMKVHSWYDSGVEVDFVFDADGFLNCETHALVNAVRRARVDPDLKPGRILQVAVE